MEINRLDQLAWLHSEHAKKGVELLHGRGRLQVLHDLRLDTIFTEQADRLPGFTSMRVVPNGYSHGEVPPLRR